MSTPELKWDAQRIAALTDPANAVQESPTLEFKRGAKLGTQNDQTSTLVKQVTGMANAGGGTIVYGVAEGDVQGVQCAVGLSPVTDAKLNANWVASVVHGRTAPPLRNFSVTQVAVQDGFVLVIEVERGLTAHQSLFDQKYYQRGAKSTDAMLDHQIRDVMGRRTTPKLETEIRVRRELRSEMTQRFCLEVSIENLGQVRAQAWRIEVDLPTGIFADTEGSWAYALGAMKVMRTSAKVGQDDVDRFAFSSASSVPSGFDDIYPGQVIKLDGSVGLPELYIDVDEAVFQKLRRMFGPPIRFRHYSADQPATEYEIPFEKWCWY